MVELKGYFLVCYICNFKRTDPVPCERNRICFFTSLHGACQKRGDLRAGAGGSGVEATAAHAGGDAVLHGPRHGLRVVAVSGDVGKARRTARHSIVTIWARLMAALGFAPSEIPLVFAQFCAFSNQVAPPVKSASFCRARIVHSCARVVELLGA